MGLKSDLHWPVTDNHQDLSVVNLSNATGKSHSRPTGSYGVWSKPTFVTALSEIDTDYYISKT